MHSNISRALRASLLFFLFVSASEGRFLNNYDKPFAYQCPGGQYLRGISSVHHNHYEDRVFSVLCDPLPPKLNANANARCQWSNYVNDFDQGVAYQCPGDGYIAGLGSYHSNHHEDRRFRFFCCTLPNTKIHDCSYSGWVNNFDQPVAYNVPIGKVMRGMTSYHSNHHEDRRFKFNVCSLTKHHSGHGHGR